MEVVTQEVTWTCGCDTEHRPTIARAWCFACGEWCYPKALCVRGEVVMLRAALDRAGTALAKVQPAIDTTNCAWALDIVPNAEQDIADVLAGR